MPYLDERVGTRTAAGILRVSDNRVLQLVRAGRLTPLNPDTARPGAGAGYQFALSEILQRQQERVRENLRRAQRASARAKVAKRLQRARAAVAAARRALEALETEGR